MMRQRLGPAREEHARLAVDGEQRHEDGARRAVAGRHHEPRAGAERFREADDERLVHGCDPSRSLKNCAMRIPGQQAGLKTPKAFSGRGNCSRLEALTPRRNSLRCAPRISTLPQGEGWTPALLPSPETG